MHRNLHRISVHQRLDALGLVSTGQLIRCVNIYFDLAARCLIHKLAKLAACLCPGTGFCRGTRKVPGHFRPVQVTMIFYLISRRIFNARRLNCTSRIFSKGVYQILCIIKALVFQFSDKPFRYRLSCFFKGFDVEILIFQHFNTVLSLPTIQNLLIACTVDLTLVSNRLTACLINNRLLLRRQAVIQLLVDAEEQTVIVCVPQGNIFLYFLYTRRINRRKRVLLPVYRALLQRRIRLGPVHIGRIGAPELIALHQKVRTSYTQFQVLHIFHGMNRMFAVGQLTETILRHTHTMQAIAFQDLNQLVARRTI